MDWLTGLALDRECYSFFFVNLDVVGDVGGGVQWCLPFFDSAMVPQRPLLTCGGPPVCAGCLRSIDVAPVGSRFVEADVDSSGWVSLKSQERCEWCR